MDSYVTFSNKVKKSHQMDYKKVLAKAKEDGIPTKQDTYSDVVYESIDYNKLTDIQKDRVKYIQEQLQREEIQEYIDKNWPDDKVTIVDIRRLPYPAIGSFGSGRTPNFCYTPEECAGRSCCPKNRSCCD